MIAVNQEVTVNHLEELFTELLETKHNEYVDLRLHPNLDCRGFGTFPLLLQLIITWRRLENSGRLIIGSKDVTEEEIESFVRRYYGLVATVASWDKDIINFNGANLKNSIRKYNAALMQLLLKSDFAQAARGDSILFPFFDHIDSKSGLLPILYHDGKIRAEEEFENVCDTMIDIATKNNQSIKEEFRSIVSDLSGIIYETFDNTNKWARHSFTGGGLSPSIRGIYGKFHKWQYRNISSYANSIELARYFKEIDLRNTSLDKFIKFLEVSIFDSGSGLVQRYSGMPVKDLSIDDEYKYLVECLKKHNTSHKEIGIAPSRGIGLHRIMDLLDKKKGFLQVRSGRLSLSRNFLKYPFLAPSGNPNYALLDVDSLSTIPTEKAKVEGTLITIIIPQPI